MYTNLHGNPLNAVEDIQWQVIAKWMKALSQIFAKTYNSQPCISIFEPFLEDGDKRLKIGQKQLRIRVNKFKPDVMQIF